MRTKFLLASSAGLMALACNPASAQDMPADNPNDDNVQLEDIVVTAQRRSENLQNAAIAVSAVSGDGLIEAGISRATELTAVIPSLQVATSGSSQGLFYIRGVGNFTGNSLQGPAVAFNVDGAYIARASSVTGYFYDLERVEVLKGPQGTLYGRNATGGAVNVLTRRPKLGEFGGYVTAEYGNYDAIRLDGALNVPLDQDAALRVAGTHVRHDPYMEDGTDKQDDLGGRASLLWEPTGTLKISLVADAFRQRGSGTGSTPVQLGIDDRPGFLSPEGQAFMATQPNTLMGRTALPMTTRPYVDSDFWGVTATIDWETPAGTFTLIPSHREAKLDYLVDSSGFYVGAREKDTQTSVELRLASDSAQRLRYVFGAYLFDEMNDVPFFYVNQQSSVNLNDYRLKNKSMAAFGQLTFEIAPDVRLNAGARYTTEDKSLDGRLQGRSHPCVRPSTFFPTYVPGCPTATAFPVDGTLPAIDLNPLPDFTLTTPSLIDASGPRARRQSFERVTYRISADWNITDRNLVYASKETGFKSGGFFFSADSGIYRPETITAYTLGSKNRFFDNRFQINLEAFYWRYRDQQISHISTDSAGNVILATENVGRASLKGIELETRYLPTSTTELSIDAQYLDAEYKAFQYQLPNRNNGAGNGTGCATAAVTAVAYTVDCSGKRPPNAPKWTVNLSGEQRVPLGSAGDLRFVARAHYQSETLTGLEFLAPQYQEGYWQLDGLVEFRTADENISVALFANNILDKDVIASTFQVPFTSYTAASLRPPRTYGIRSSLKF